MQRLKKRYYKTLLKKIVGAEGFLVLTLNKMWDDI
jgi:hypothetical protein